MNWELITRDKQGETQISLLWISLLIVYVGFLFGIGFSAVNTIVYFLFLR